MKHIFTAYQKMLYNGSDNVHLPSETSRLLASVSNMQPGYCPQQKQFPNLTSMTRQSKKHCYINMLAGLVTHWSSRKSTVFEASSGGNSK